jgi:hypothetical protein
MNMKLKLSFFIYFLISLIFSTLFSFRVDLVSIVDVPYKDLNVIQPKVSGFENIQRKLVMEEFLEKEKLLLNPFIFLLFLLLCPKNLNLLMLQIIQLFKFQKSI